MRKLAIIAALLLLLPATPALATGTIHCRSRSADGPEVYFVIGRGAGAAIVQMTLNDGRRQFSTGSEAGSPVILQSWLDADELKIDVVDSNAERLVARLRAARAGEGRYRGTLVYGEARHAMTCESEG